MSTISNSSTGRSDMTPREAFDQIVQFGCFAADNVAIDFVGTRAQETRAVVSRALGALAANGFIEIKDPDAWPFAFAPEQRLPEECDPSKDRPTDAEHGNGHPSPDRCSNPGCDC